VCQLLQLMSVFAPSPLNTLLTSSSNFVGPDCQTSSHFVGAPFFFVFGGGVIWSFAPKATYHCLLFIAYNLVQFRIWVLKFKLSSPSFGDLL